VVGRPLKNPYKSIPMDERESRKDDRDHSCDYKVFFVRKRTSLDETFYMFGHGEPIEVALEV
jgi:hypothetical protein